MSEYIKIEGVEFHKDSGKQHSLSEFERLHPKLKNPKAAYKKLGGTIPKLKKEVLGKDSDKD